MKIFFYWEQGKDKIPEWATLNLNIWKRLNPNHEIIIFDSSNIKKLRKEIVNFDNYSVQVKSDLLRIYLLSENKGCWCDITTVPSVSLDQIISNLNHKELFMYSKPTEDRLFSTWFIISQHTSLFKSLFEISKNFFSAERKLIEGSRDLVNDNLESTKAFFANKSDCYPYFWFHYLINKLYLEDKSFHKYFSDVDVILADGPHLLQAYLKRTELNELNQNEINNIYLNNFINKIDWRIDKHKLMKFFEIILA